jgi:hypothetical protein
MSYQVIHMWISLWLVRNFIAGSNRYPQLFDAFFTLLRCKKEYSGAMENRDPKLEQFIRARGPILGRNNGGFIIPSATAGEVLNRLTRRVQAGFNAALALTKWASSPPPWEYTDAETTRAKEYLRGLVLKTEANLKRRNSDEVGWAHSERVAETAYHLARFVYGDNKGKLNRVVILALLHDAVEDFGGDLKTIELMFGKSMARSVAMVTTPKTSVLAFKHQDITAKYLPSEDLSAFTAEMMAMRMKQLKAGNHAQYKLLKSSLSRQHKLDTFPQYGLDETIVKIADNGDSPHADTKDIAATRIHIEVPSAPHRSDKTRRSWPETKIRQKVDNRTEFHVALITQLKKVWNTYKERGNPELKSPNFSGLIAQASQFFTSKVENLERITGLSFRVPEPI